jgi:AcrR family transcriptional regulator
MSDRPFRTGSAQRRERILDSAARSFAVYGYRHSTFEEIASGAGVSRTLLYRHFENKLDLLRAVQERALGEWAESVEREAERCQSARDQLEATVTETLRFANAHPIFRAFLSGDSRLALHGDHRRGRLSRDAWREQTAKILRRGIDEGQFGPELDTDATADVLCAMQLGLIEQMHHDGDGGLVLGAAHIAVASRVLVGGVVGPLTAQPEPARAS